MVDDIATLHTNGRQLTVYNPDGTRTQVFSDSVGTWALSNNVIKNVRKNGVELMLQMIDESATIAHKISPSAWLAKVITGATGSFIWPFNPNDIGTEWEGYPGHKGVDWPKPDGTPIIAAQAGTVTLSGWYPGDLAGWGNVVEIDHGAIGVNDAVLTTVYAHMNAAPLPDVGDTVAQGEVIGYVGTTGVSTGNHLHWETAVNGRWNQINPRLFMAEYGE